MSRRKSTRKTPSKRVAEEEQEAEANESVDNKLQEMVSVSRRELDLLRSIQAEWEKAQVETPRFLRALFLNVSNHHAAAGAATARDAADAQGKDRLGSWGARERE
jgi:hypothetical protein